MRGERKKGNHEIAPNLLSWRSDLKGSRIERIVLTAACIYYRIDWEKRMKEDQDVPNSSFSSLQPHFITTTNFLFFLIKAKFLIFSKEK